MDEINDVMRLVNTIRPVMYGKGSAIQGAVLADLLATWLAGHFADTPAATSRLRATLLKEHLAVVRKLIPEAEKDVLRHNRKRAS